MPIMIAIPMTNRVPLVASLVRVAWSEAASANMTAKKKTIVTAMAPNIVIIFTFIWCISPINLIVMVSNQSYYNKKVKIQGYIDNVDFFNDKFLVGNQHLVSYYYINLADGEHSFVIKSEDGASLNENIEIGKEKTWVYISYGNDEKSNPILHYKIQNEPFCIK